MGLPASILKQVFCYSTFMKWIIGIDEVGRGPLAGPVTVCAVAMRSADYTKARWVGLADSKQMTSRSRDEWYIRARDMEHAGTIRIALASRTAAQIDKKGIAVCIRDCITTALTELGIDPNSARVLLDGGLKAPLQYQNQQTIIKGDQKHKIISLASVVAKVTRDAYMVKISKKYPGYGWELNKGYGTATHRKALKKLYITRLHRKSFLSRILDI